MICHRFIQQESCACESCQNPLLCLFVFEENWRSFLFELEKKLYCEPFFFLDRGIQGVCNGRYRLLLQSGIRIEERKNYMKTLLSHPLFNWFFFQTLKTEITETKRIYFSFPGRFEATKRNLERESTDIRSFFTKTRRKPRIPYSCQCFPLSTDLKHYP
jgi:hypothetical protein